VEIYGAVDSLREGPAGSSFSRYEYPSTLPAPVPERMGDIAARVIRQVGYDDAPFNIEFYWEEDSDRIWLLEINCRISKSHAPLFQMVDGCYHHQVMIDLTLGRQPAMRHREGRFGCAAKFMLRRQEDARVIRVPSDAEIAAVEADIPEVVVLPAMENFPSDDVTADTRRINELLEHFIRRAPEQYLWVHRRFKTRPPGSPSVYNL